MIARLVTAAFALVLFAYAAAVVLSILAAGFAVYGMFRAVRYLWRTYRARVAEREHVRAELVARAEIQHRWYLAGDPRGTYGRYRPSSIT